MNGPVLFVDAARAGRADADAVAKILSIDAYRARLLLNARVPFLAQGFPSHGYAVKAAEGLEATGIPASAHTSGDVGRVPAGIAAGAATKRASSWLFKTGETTVEVPFDSLRALVYAKLTAKLPDEEPGLGLDLPILKGRGTRGMPSAPTPRQPIQCWRLDVFAEPRAGECVRLCVRHDLFDFACLLERKTLSAIRNLAALRDEISHSRPKGDVPVDEWFDRTELARAAFVSDSWTDFDLRSGSHRKVAVQSNRAAFEEFSAIRFLHERSRIQERADHYFEL